MPGAYFQHGNMIKLVYIFLFVSLLLFSCRGNSEKDDAVARVYDQYLPLSALDGIVPQGIYGNDSVQVVRDYINNWVEQQLLLHQAEGNLSKDQKNFTLQLEDYRNSLIIFAYERELIRQKLDTIVSETEIAEYYESHKADFELKDNIVKVWYVKLLRNAPVSKFRQLMRYDKPEALKTLMDLSARHAANSFLDDNNWLLFNDILKEIPIHTYNQEEYLKNNRFIEIQDSAYIYLMNIKGFMIKESISPLGFEKQNIRDIIINKRKLKLIADMRKELHREAVRKGEIEMIKK